MKNRRNLYRILYVQPEAPIEIIKASYRSLMTKLNAHPDLGGDHESAVLINQAYAILSDPVKRRQYDEMLFSRKSQMRGRPVQKEFGVNQSGWNGDKEPSSAALHSCLFCAADLSFSPRVNKHCIHCASPLTPAQPVPDGRLRELFGRRSSVRIAKAGAVVIYPNWPHTGYPAQLRDLSPSGISMLTKYGARSGQVLKFNSDNLHGIARVVSVQANGANFLLHALFLTAEYVSKSGVFVTEKA
ncbi:MAG: DnaJ domain-containing protein [Methylococcales bacterium]|nr:DnaJ domain-containing protein [Methylococcales bacterium]